MSFDIFLSPPDVGPRERDLMLEAFDSGYVAPAGPMLERFEREFAQSVGIAHAVAMSSGTAALQVALHLIGVQAGDAVIVPTLTFMGGVAPLIYLGATPIFVDCDEDLWGLDADLLEDAFAITARKGLTVKAVVPADLYGQCCDIDAIRQVSDRFGAPVVLDSAEGVGATAGGRPAGHGAVAAAYSFNGNKIITTSGGGMLVSNDKAFIDRARYLSTAARMPVPHYQHEEVGYNYRLSNISAAIGIGQLESLEQRVARRREIFRTYVDRLGGRPGVSFAPEGPGRRHTRWLSVILLEPGVARSTPDELRVDLAAAGIEARPVWKPMHMQPVFRDADVVGGDRARRLYDTGLCLPSGSTLRAADLDRICEVISKRL